MTLSDKHSPSNLIVLKSPQKIISSSTFRLRALDSFDLSVSPGQVVAIVGHSGSGKSTVCALLERFYDHDGEICVDGVSVRQLSPHWLRSKAIGYISQEPVLFVTSIAENIRYGKPDATDAEVVAVANCHDFIMQFPVRHLHGHAQRQKQRIAITRALLKQPKILILDEDRNRNGTRRAAAASTRDTPSRID